MRILKKFSEVPERSIFDHIMWNSVFDQKFMEDFESVFAGDSTRTFPKVNIIDELESITIIAELAGWKSQDIKITIGNGKRLTISGENSEKPSSEKKYLLRELKRSKFQRTFLLGEILDNGNVTATFVDGLLTITINKRPLKTNTTEEITIKTSNS